MFRFLVIFYLLPIQSLDQNAFSSIPIPSCTNLTGSWCCEETVVVQTGINVATSAIYGTGIGIVTNYTINITFTNAPNPIIGTLALNCNSISWENGAQWVRSAKPWIPSVPAPEWASNLSAILEINALAYTSPNGNGTGDGSGTFASLTAKVPYLQSLGINGLWLAYYNIATRHFYGIRSVYAAIDPQTIDPTLGTPEDFTTFVTACHTANIKVFLDVIGHGLVNESKWIKLHPEWFNGGSWGMVDYNYSNIGFLDWWASVWEYYILGQETIENGVDGFRIDISDPSWWTSGIWDKIANKAVESGHPVAIWGESSRYHFSQHDLIAPINNLTQHAVGDKALGNCLNTLQLSCHDSGWENNPGNYFFLKGSRAQFANGALHVYIPLWLGGDEYDEDPVIDLPLLKKDLYGTSGLPGGWMYGSVRNWSQLDNPSSRQSLMLADTTALLSVQRLHADVLHRNVCIAEFMSLNNAISGTDAPLTLDPFARWLPSIKAILILANDGLKSANIVINVPLSVMGFNPNDFFDVTVLYGAGEPIPKRMSGLSLSMLNITIQPDLTPGGGAHVIMITPVA